MSSLADATGRVKPDHPTPPTKALEIEVLGMTKRFGAFTALDNVTMKVKSGTLHALLGENGAGKSTLVKCLVGFYPADAGQITVDGREAQIRTPHDLSLIHI